MFEVITAAPLPSSRIPPPPAPPPNPLVWKLLVIVFDWIVGDENSTAIPPPPKGAEFPVMMLPKMVGEPDRTMMSAALTQFRSTHAARDRKACDRRHAANVDHGTDSIAGDRGNGGSVCTDELDWRITQRDALRISAWCNQHNIAAGCGKDSIFNRGLIGGDVNCGRANNRAFTDDYNDENARR